MKRYRWEDITVEDLFINRQFGTIVESYSDNRQLVVGRRQVFITCSKSNGDNLINCS